MEKMAINAEPITPSDLLALPGATTGGILVSVAGNLAVTTLGGSRQILAVPAGWIPLVVTQVWSTGTTATGLTALRN